MVDAIKRAQILMNWQSGTDEKGEGITSIYEETNFMVITARNLLFRIPHPLFIAISFDPFEMPSRKHIVLLRFYLSLITVNSLIYEIGRHHNSTLYCIEYTFIVCIVRTYKCIYTHTHSRWVWSNKLYRIYALYRIPAYEIPSRPQSRDECVVFGMNVCEIFERKSKSLTFYGAQAHGFDLSSLTLYSIESYITENIKKEPGQLNIKYNNKIAFEKK